jgi:hypothetical protein
MKVTLIIISACLIGFVLYFLFNVYFLLKNKFNNIIKLNSKKDAVKFLVFSLLLTPLLGFYINNQMDQMVAESNGFDTVAAFNLASHNATAANLSLPEYQLAIKEANAAGFSDYNKYQNHLLAKDNGYDNFQDYQLDIRFAKSYGFPLEVYKKAKAESVNLNYEYFDDYLIYKEKSSLKHKLTLISKLSGDYNIENVPLGASKDELLALVNDCKIDKIPNYSFPLTKTLAPRNNAHVKHFFPETETDGIFGLTAYSLNFSVMPGLDMQAISKYEMKCESSRYDLWFLNSNNRLVMYEKNITLPTRSFTGTVEQIEDILSAKCDDEINVGLEMTFEENGKRAIKNLYCKNFQNYIIATIIDAPTITGVKQEPDIHVGYLNDRLWKKYINNLHAIKGKKRNAQMNQDLDAKRIIEDRI